MMVDKMALDLGLTRKFVANFSRSASHAYKFYTIPKRNGGERPIHHPSKQLKSMRWLLAYVIEPLPVHPAATAYRKHRSILDNARIHAASRFLLRMGSENFFPSITEDDVLLYIQQRPSLFPGWTPFDIEVFCKLICRNGRLTVVNLAPWHVRGREFESHQVHQNSKSKTGVRLEAAAGSRPLEKDYARSIARRLRKIIPATPKMPARRPP